MRSVGDEEDGKEVNKGIKAASLGREKVIKEVGRAAGDAPEEKSVAGAQVAGKLPIFSPVNGLVVFGRPLPGAGFASKPLHKKVTRISSFVCLSVSSHRIWGLFKNSDVFFITPCGLFLVSINQ